MAEAIGTHAVDVSINELAAPVDIIFIGGAIYGGKLDDALVRFINNLSPDIVRRAVVFSSYFMGESAPELIAKLLKERDVTADRGALFL